MGLIFGNFPATWRLSHKLTIHSFFCFTSVVVASPSVAVASVAVGSAAGVSSFLASPLAAVFVSVSSSEQFFLVFLSNLSKKLLEKPQNFYADFNSPKTGDYPKFINISRYGQKHECYLK